MYLNFGVLGPILFTLYVVPVAGIANKHGVSRMLYADNIGYMLNSTKAQWLHPYNI